MFNQILKMNVAFVRDTLFKDFHFGIVHLFEKKKNSEVVGVVESK